MKLQLKALLLSGLLVCHGLCPMSAGARNLATEPRLHAHPMPRGGVNGHGVLHGASEGTKKGEKPKVFIWSWGVVNQQATKAR